MTAPESKREKIKQRIEKLINLSGNNPSEEEANSAAKRAAELMTEYGIEKIELFKSQDTMYSAEFIVTKDINIRDNWRVSLSMMVAKYSGGRTLYNKRANAIYWFAIDREAIDSIREIYFWIEKQFHRLTELSFAMEKITNPNPPHGKAYKNSYRLGLLTGLQDRYLEIQNANSTALVLLSDAVDRKVNEVVPRRTKMAGSSGPSNRGAYSQGRTDASRISMNNSNRIGA